MFKLRTFGMLFMLVSSFAAANTSELNVYSARNEKLIKPIIEAYSIETGIKVNLVSAKEQEIINSIAQNEAKTADVLLLSDSAILWQASNAGILQKIDTNNIKQNINNKYLNNDWIATSMRLRTIVYSAERVKPTQLNDYADLADEKWHGKLCLRTSKKIYNQSLVVALHNKYGDKTLNILKGFINNLGADIFPNDNAVINAIAEGTCDVGIVNSYYFAKLIAENNNLPVNIFMPKNGVFSNVSGAAIIKNAPNPKQALHFINWLLSEKGQRLIADANFEFPVNPKAKIRTELSKWGDFNEDLTMIITTKEASQLEQAKNLIKQAKWD